MTVFYQYFEAAVTFLYNQIIWLFSGVGIVIIASVYAIYKKRYGNLEPKDANLEIKQNDYEYESNHVHTRLDIKVRNGRNAELVKTQEITFMREGVAELTDVIACSGSSEVIATENIKYIGVKELMGSIAVQRFQLPRIPRKGERFRYRIDRKLADTLSASEEYWELEIVRPTGFFIFEVVFPRSRPFLAYKGVTRTQYKSGIAEQQPVAAFEGDRKALRWEVSMPKVGTTYRIEWEW